jgi:ankyrin repeat protein
MTTLFPGATQVHLAVEQNDINKLKTFSKQELLVTDNDGETPLHYAATNGNKIMCDWLIDKCPELRNMKDIEGNTAIYWAQKHSNITF